MKLERTNHHTTRLWLDKVCIDQADISADLQCLPIYLSACCDLLIISGRTYTSRLWCCVELFVYVQMTEEDETRAGPTIITIGANDAEHSTARFSWRNFDAAVCECFNQDDKARIFAVVEGYPGGVSEFNRYVKAIALNIFGEGRRFSEALTNVSGCSSYTAGDAREGAEILVCAELQTLEVMGELMIPI